MAPRVQAAVGLRAKVGSEDGALHRGDLRGPDADRHDGRQRLRCVDDPRGLRKEFHLLLTRPPPHARRPRPRVLLLLRLLPQQFTVAWASSGLALGLLGLTPFAPSLFGNREPLRLRGAGLISSLRAFLLPSASALVRPAGRGLMLRLRNVLARARRRARVGRGAVLDVVQRWEAVPCAGHRGQAVLRGNVGQAVPGIGKGQH
mmetsp:Transcript_78978/g.231849  ORF Transcript_78978/g.231849 Transcript_78978/m.231849 type:complete len:203 (-) Transcript_78978:286-894(-)